MFCVFWLQCSNESVFAADFHPTDSNIVVTCGKSHLYFWNLEKGVLVKKQGLFEVKHHTLPYILASYLQHSLIQRHIFIHNNL